MSNLCLAINFVLNFVLYVWLIECWVVYVAAFEWQNGSCWSERPLVIKR